MVLLVSEPNLGPDEQAVLSEVIASNWITMGDRVRAFENAFAAEHGVADAVAVNSCTAALHLALQAVGVGPGDEVLVPSMSFVATSNAVLYTGARPVFVDIQSSAVPLMSCVDAAAKATGRTKAVIIMHYAGYLADQSEWMDLVRSRGLLLIEDSAHAVGRGRTGLYGDAAAFSFYGNKNMTTGEGGMIIANDPSILAKARQARGHGMTSDTIMRLRGRPASYDVTMLGHNYRMDELAAAIGVVQLKKLPGWNDKRETLSRIYREVLGRYCPEVVVPFSTGWVSAHHIMPVVLPAHADRHDVMNRLRDAGIQTSVHYPPIHLLTLYRDMYPGVVLPLTEAFAEQELTLPLHPKMEASDVEAVGQALAGALMRRRRAA
jgi:dTDP-4-amino-4,6-dideoxygalactose transaminase